MKSLLKKYEIKELSLSLFGAGVTVGKKNDVHGIIEEQGQSVKQEVLRELFIIRNTLSEFYFRYKVMDDNLANSEPDEDERQYTISYSFFNDVFEIYAQVSTILFGSKYFVLMKMEEQSKVIDIFDYVLFEKVMMEENDDYYLDQEEKVSLVVELKNLFEQITNQIHFISNSLSK